jgi:hypothetical protein
MQQTKCSKCGSADVISDAYLHPVGDATRIDVCYDRDPQAWVNKETVTSKISVRLCRACGAIDLYATDFAGFRDLRPDHKR